MVLCTEFSEPGIALVCIVQICTLVIVMDNLRVEPMELISTRQRCKSEPMDLTIPDIADEIDRIELILEMMEVDD